MRMITFSVSAVALLLMSGSSIAQSQDERAACTPDAQRFCRKDLGNDGAVQQCLQAQRAKLSRSCKKVFESHGM